MVGDLDCTRESSHQRFHVTIQDVNGLQIGSRAPRVQSGRDDGTGMTQTILKLIERLLFPKLRNTIIVALIVPGVSLVSGPAWQQYVDAYVYHTWNIKIPPVNVVSGWVLLALGLLLLVAGEYRDREVAKPKGASPLDMADSKSLHKLFSTIHLRTLNQFFHHGKGGMIYTPAAHYLDELESVIQAVQYQLHDQQMSTEIYGLCHALSAAFESIDYFTPASSPELLKFDSAQDIHTDPEARKVRDDFKTAVLAAERHLQSLCRLVSGKYPDFDFDVTDRLALDGYEESIRRIGETKAAEAAAVTDFEVMVMEQILDMEQRRIYPDLGALHSALGCDRVHVQVALDRLIGRGFVKHLYPGMLHQKYQIMAPGRAHYIATLEGSA